MGIAAWIKEACVSAATEALRLATDGTEGTSELAGATLFQMLLDGVRARWAEAEQQNAALQGGRHREEIAAAVDAAEKVKESKLRSEFENSVTVLRSVLAEAHRQEVKEVEAMFQEKIDDLKKRVNAVFADVSQPGVRNGG